MNGLFLTDTVSAGRILGVMFFFFFFFFFAVSILPSGGKKYPPYFAPQNSLHLSAQHNIAFPFEILFQSEHEFVTYADNADQSEPYYRVTLLKQ